MRALNRDIDEHARKTAAWWRQFGVMDKRIEKDLAEIERNLERIRTAGATR